MVLKHAGRQVLHESSLLCLTSSVVRLFPGVAFEFGTPISTSVRLQQCSMRRVVRFAAVVKCIKLGMCEPCSQDGLDSPARAMFESREEHEDSGQPASPQYLLPMEYTHADADAEVYTLHELLHYARHMTACDRSSSPGPHPEGLWQPGCSASLPIRTCAPCSASWCAGGGSPRS